MQCLMWVQTSAWFTNIFVTMGNACCCGQFPGPNVGKITYNGTHRCINYCEICIVHAIYKYGRGLETHDIVPDNNTPCILSTQYNYVFCTIFQPTPIIFLTNTNRLVCLMVLDCVLCEVITLFFGIVIVLRSAWQKTHRISHWKDTRGFPAGEEAGGVKLNTRIYLVHRLRRSGVVPPLLNMHEFTFFF
jgi:hypothetical protein